MNLNQAAPQAVGLSAMILVRYLPPHIQELEIESVASAFCAAGYGGRGNGELQDAAVFSGASDGVSLLGQTGREGVESGKILVLGDHTVSQRLSLLLGDVRRGGVATSGRAG